MNILCFGNLLQGDDGFGIHLHRELHGLGLPESVCLVDAGLLGLSALGYFEDCDEVIVVDAVGSPAPGFPELSPGRVRWIMLEEVDSPAVAFSSHSLDLHYLVHALPILFEGRAMPAISILGVEVQAGSGEFSMELSPKVREALPIAVDLILGRLASARGAICA